MIEIFNVLNSNGAPVIAQSKDAPSAYLDTCVLRHIAEHPGRCERFARAVHEKKGTLVLSMLAIGELANQHQRHADAVADLIDRMLPCVYFLEANLDVVDAREREFALQKSPNGSPDADDFLLPKIMTMTPACGGPLPLTFIYRTVSAMNQVIGIGDRARAYGQRTLEQLEKQYGKYRDLKEWRAYFHPREKRVQPRYATRALTKTLGKLYLSDTKRKRKGNDGIDLLHAIVPSAYCNFVVLDGPWSLLVKNATRWIRRAKIQAHVATPFGSGDADLDAFLNAFESFQPISPAAPRAA